MAGGSRIAPSLPALEREGHGGSFAPILPPSESNRKVPNKRVEIIESREDPPRPLPPPVRLDSVKNVRAARKDFVQTPPRRITSSHEQDKIERKRIRSRDKPHPPSSKARSDGPRDPRRRMNPRRRKSSVFTEGGGVLKLNKKKAGLLPRASFIQQIVGLGMPADDDELADITNQRSSSKCPTIHPSSPILAWWAVILVMSAVYEAVSIPLMIGFEMSIDSIRPGWLLGNVLFDFVFLVNLLIRLRTGYWHSGYVVKSSKRICKKYLKGRFVYDLISAIPFNMIWYFSFLGGFPVPNLFDFFRLLRLVTLNNVVYYLDSRNFVGIRVSVNPSLVRLIKLMFWIFMLSHWVCCLRFFIVSHCPPPFENLTIGRAFGPLKTCKGNSTWMVDNDLENRPIQYQYAYSFHWSLVVMSDHGYAQPETPLETIFVILVVLSGISTYATIIANVGSLLMNLDSNSIAYQRKMETIDQYLAFRKMPDDLRLDVRKYYEHVWTQRKGFDENAILADLPTPLRMQVLRELNEEFIKKIPWLCIDDKGFLNDLLKLLRHAIYPPNEAIFFRGQPGREVYFLVTGKVRVDLESGPVILGEGSVFGEISLLFDQRRTATVTTVTFSDLLYLTRRSLENLLVEYPGLDGRMREAAMDRIAELYPGKSKEIIKTLRSQTPLSSSSPAPTASHAQRVSPFFAPSPPFHAASSPLPTAETYIARAWAGSPPPAPPPPSEPRASTAMAAKVENHGPTSEKDVVSAEVAETPRLQQGLETLEGPFEGSTYKQPVNGTTVKKGNSSEEPSLPRDDSKSGKTASQTEDTKQIENSKPTARSVVEVHGGNGQFARAKIHLPPPADPIGSLSHDPSPGTMGRRRTIEDFKLALQNNGQGFSFLNRRHHVESIESTEGQAGEADRLSSEAGVEHRAGDAINGQGSTERVGKPLLKGGMEGEENGEHSSEEAGSSAESSSDESDDERERRKLAQVASRKAETAVAEAEAAQFLHGLEQMSVLSRIEEEPNGDRGFDGDANH
uniref:Cyclic nucleotide-binding domain-containing protein n=1 Tax=Palpitomonas bilix TaxID=652834 RepID=A0A7S3G5B6_9EUKA|mmetsp:Transcript_20184/g.51548  ORF Transcript_20184/g.51548 Transcript_20184/m.51548 type:complete len:1016 (+) Transcript_20184:135-3182(+)